MSGLLARVADALRAAGVAPVLGGATALATHGIARSTADVDVLVHGGAALLGSTWEALSRAGVRVEIRRGDSDDPLAGVVRVGDVDERVDVVVLRGAEWQRDALARATPGSPVPVLRAADLVLFKLFAGGYVDRTDVAALVALLGAPLVAEVDALAPALPGDAQALWRALRTP